MKGVTKAMGQMNRQMNLPSLQKIMQEFERQNEKMELVTEVMADSIDDALEGDEEEEETEELVSQVLDEIGIDINQEVFCHCYPFILFMIDNAIMLLSLTVLLRSECSTCYEQWLMCSYCHVQLVNAPSNAVATPAAAKTKVPQVETAGNEDSGIDGDLQARLDNLRRM